MSTTTVQDQLDAMRRKALVDLDAASDLAAITAWERAYLGAKGELTLFLRGLGSLSAEERPIAGRAGNAIKVELTAAYEAKQTLFAATALDQHLDADAIDISLPGRRPLIGGSHPVSQVIDELSEIFALLGYQTVFGPEVETGRYNFDLLNIPADHPARDVWDTFHVEADEEIVLRTHTSPMQARTMERQPPPVRVVVPGKAFRYEAQDASHEWMFHQLEGLAIDTNITMSDLKGTLAEVARQLFGQKRQIRFRCDFFPFVEPGVDFAVDCAICDGKGCRVCKQTGWLEMGGAGMVHPNVLRYVGYDPDQVSGFAFGLGVDRIAMVRSGVDDIRAFAANDLRFLRQFARVA
jgi:phenylalanyl-tRNA synthetase alpha chain